MILVCQFVIHSPLNWLIVFEMFTNQFCLANHPKGWFFVLASPWFLNVSLIVLTSFFSDAKVIFISETSLYENFWTFSGCWLKCFLLAKFAKKKLFVLCKLIWKNPIRSTAFFTLYTLKFTKSSWIVGPVI